MPTTKKFEFIVALFVMLFSCSRSLKQFHTPKLFFKRPLSFIIPTEHIGNILIEQRQRSYQRLDAKKIKTVTRKILELTNCSHMDVGVLLCGDRKIQNLNCRVRKIRRPTDILSFPFHDAKAIDGDFVGGSQFIQSEDDMNLGDMYISVPYVLRVMRCDSEEAVEVGEADWKEQIQETRGVSGELMKCITIDEKLTPRLKGVKSEEVEDGQVKGSEVDTGVNESLTKKDVIIELEEKEKVLLEKRVCLLLVHGILHLMGHDHESYGGTNKRVEEMYDLMVKEEERIITHVTPLLQ